MKQIVLTIIILYSPSLMAGDYVQKYVIDRSNLEDPVKKTLDACLAENRLEVCKSIKFIKDAVNFGANKVTKEAKTIALAYARDIGVEKPVAAAIYVAKIARDKEITIKRIKLPLVNNKAGRITLSEDKASMTLEWSW